MNKSLRAELSSIEIQIHLHPEEVSKISKKYGADIICINDKDSSSCVCYAFCFDQRPKTHQLLCRRISDPKGELIFPNKKFIRWMIKEEFLKIKTNPEIGDFILYFSRENVDCDFWNHVGVLSDNGKILSRWGEYPTYRHDIFDVPASYGDYVYYFNSIRPVESDKLLMIFYNLRYKGETL